MSSFGFVPGLHTGLSKARLGDYKTELLCMRHLSLKCAKEFSVDTGLYDDRASQCKTELRRILECVCIWNWRFFVWVSTLRQIYWLHQAIIWSLYYLSLSWKLSWWKLRLLIYKNKLVTETYFRLILFSHGFYYRNGWHYKHFSVLFCHGGEKCFFQKSDYS